MALRADKSFGVVDWSCPTASKSVCNTLQHGFNTSTDFAFIICLYKRGLTGGLTGGLAG